MKTFLALLAVATACLAAEVPGPTGLLVLPRQDNSSTSTTPRTAVNGTDNPEDVHAKLSERLKQEQGSEQGVFHVYLQDGRLQRVQYTTAPVTPGQQSQQQQTAPNTNNQQQTPEILSPQFAERRGVYFVQVPQERIQALQANAQQVAPQTSQTPAQYSQEDSSPVNVRYLPLEASSQYRQEAPEEAVLRYLAVPLTEQSGQYGRQYDGQEQRQAVVQYSQVLPISGPVYSYSPRALTRILRGAPVY